MEKEKELIDEDKGNKYSLVRYARERIKKNKNFVMCFTGPTGSGKSWCALSYAELIDDDFDIDRVVFRAKDLMELINSGKLKSGSVILWDEAGIDLSNRNWQSTMNKVINYLLQTFRHRNFILIFTVPYTDFLDAASRKLFHANFETVGINRQKKTCTVKPKMLQYNANMNKFYAKYLKAIKNHRKVKIRRWAVPAPSKELIKKYEEKKLEFTSNLNKDIMVSLNDSVGSGVKIRYSHRDYYIAWHLLGRKQKNICEALDKTSGGCSQVVQVMDKLYPEWRNDRKMLGFEVSDIRNIRNLSPTQLKFLENAKIPLKIPLKSN